MDTKNEAPISCEELPASTLEKVSGGLQNNAVDRCPYCGSTNDRRKGA